MDTNCFPIKRNERLNSISMNYIVYIGHIIYFKKEIIMHRLIFISACSGSKSGGKKIDNNSTEADTHKKYRKEFKSLESKENLSKFLDTHINE